ncbi:lipase family protein [Pelagicoccus mobilis]|uniref:Lipase family protein n=1 Tax=Pelagicoccus mobilis TaxID=415221 RepID=A0A934VTE2_9BACT|nr:lipase family protein [Pelagicoccus mobilis]MBK1879439.1 lipase family protein [Pelagicoccus mobilis]
MKRISLKGSGHRMPVEALAETGPQRPWSAFLFFLFTLQVSLLAAPSGSLSHEALFGPNKSFDYFAKNSELVTESPRLFSAANASMLAQSSMLAYVTEQDFITETFAEIGYDSTEFFDREGTFAYLAEDERNIIVSFRGTESADRIDYLTDARFIQKDFTIHGKAHSGFILALSKVESQILYSIKKRTSDAPDKKVWLTGHSMGAALATLFAIKYPEEVDAVYAIGSPRTVNKALAQHWHERLPLFRIVNNNDLVTRVPSPPFYQHIGPTYFLTSEGQLIIDPPKSRKWKDRLKGHGQFARRLIEEHWAQADFSAIPSDYFVDHSPLFYVEALQALALE